jgi:multiple sugar transport system ATP-binding protein
MASIELSGVGKAFGRHHVLSNLDLTIDDGEFVALVGPSGCGKSTTLRLIAGLEETTSGEVRIGTRVVNNLEPKDRDIAMVFQNYAIYPHLSVRQNIAFGLFSSGLPKAAKREKVRSVAAMLGLEALLDRRPSQLSGGQRQRVAIGRAMVRDPAAFLFDEPLSNLDAQLRAQMRSEIKQLHRQLGTTVVYVTHDQVEAMTMADRIVIMSLGKVLQIGAPMELYNAPANVFSARFIGTPAINLVAATVGSSGGGAQIVLADGLGSVPLPPDRIAPAAGRLVVGIRPHDLRPAEEVPGGADLFHLDGHITEVEPLGSETLLHVAVAGQGLVAVTAQAVPALGAPVRLAVPPARLHLFDAARETALARA